MTLWPLKSWYLLCIILYVHTLIEMWIVHVQPILVKRPLFPASRIRTLTESRQWGMSIVEASLSMIVDLIVVNATIDWGSFESSWIVPGLSGWDACPLLLYQLREPVLWWSSLSKWFQCITIAQLDGLDTLLFDWVLSLFVRDSCCEVYVTSRTHVHCPTDWHIIVLTL